MKRKERRCRLAHRDAKSSARPMSAAFDERRLETGQGTVARVRSGREATRVGIEPDDGRPQMWLAAARPLGRHRDREISALTTWVSEHRSGRARAEIVADEIAVVNVDDR